MEDVNNETYEYGDYVDECNAKEDLLKVVRKCVADDFPISEYGVFDMEFGLTFVNVDNYYNLNINNIRTIYFYCPKDKELAIPYSLDGNTKCQNCYEALSR